MKNIKTKTKFLLISSMAVLGLFGGILEGPNKALAASNITCNSATISGRVITNGTPTYAWFEWGPNGSLGNSTPHILYNYDQDDFANLTGLQQNTTYSYRGVAQNQYGSAYGETKTFTTSSCQQSNPPTVSLTADNSNIAYNGTTTVRWNSQNATSCSASGGTNGWSGSKSLSGSFFTGNLTSSTTYNINCTSSTGQQAFDSVTVSVAQQQTCQDPNAINYGGNLPCRYQQTPTVTLYANPTSIQSGQNSNLTWNSTNATSCFAYWTSSTATSGSGIVVPTTTTTYTMTCTSSTGQQASATATVSVTQATCQDPNAINYGGSLPCRYQQAPTVSIYANPSSVAYNGASTITWNSNNATSCTGTSGTYNWAGSKSLSGTFNTGPLTGNTTFGITCYNGSGQQANASVIVYVAAQPPQTCQDYNAINYGGSLPCRYQQTPTVTLYANPTSIQSGQNSNLTWNSTNATSCFAYWTSSTATSGSGIVVPTTTTTYTMTCTSSTGQQASATATVSVTQATCQDSNAINYGGSLPCRYQQTPTVTLNANPSNIQSGQNSNLTWNSTNATSCFAYWTSNTATSGSGIVVPTTTTTYTMTCTSSTGQQASATATVSVNQVQNPTVDIRADDTTIDFGDSTILRWNSNNADSCRGSDGDNGWSGSKNLDGSFNTGSLEDDTTYRITCINNSGSSNDSVTVRVDNNDNDNEPNVTTRNATDISTTNATLNGRVDGNGSSVSAWFQYGTNTNLGSTTSRNSYGSGSTNFSRSISGLSPNTTYYFRAVAENSQDTVYGNILSFNTENTFINPPVNQQPTVVISADQTNLAFNGATTIRWSTTNATSCNASNGSVGWAGAKSIGPGSFYTGSLTITRIYTITCSNNVGSSTSSVTVGVRGIVLGTTTTRPAPTSLVLISSSVNRNQPIVPTIDNTRPRPGDEINYTVSYQNIGTGAITGLTLRIDLPFEVDYIFSNPSNPTRSGNTLIFNLGTLRANGEGTVTVRVRVRENTPAGTNLNFPAILSYIDPSGFPQTVTANVSAQVWSEPIPAVSAVSENVPLGANAFWTGFLPNSILGWLILLILILILILLTKYIFSQSFKNKTITTLEQPSGKKTTTTTIE